MIKQFFKEAAREIPVAGSFDVIVAGGGPAGVAAAIASARNGAKTLLLEQKECLGGIWTSGLMSWILDHSGKAGIMEELKLRLTERGGYLTCNNVFTAPPEEIRFLLEEMCFEAGVVIRYGTIVCGAFVEKRLIQGVITESKSGREAWSGKIFIDTTGDGDLAARAGCSFDYGNAQGHVQPASLIAMLGGIDPKKSVDYFTVAPDGKGKERLFEALCRAGCRPSYEHPSLFHFGCGIVGLMSHHAYGVCGCDAASRTEAILSGRRELHRQIEALRTVKGFENTVFLGTSEQLGIRECRRIHGRYRVTVEELKKTELPPHTVCISRFPVDVHSPDPETGRTLLDTGYCNPAGFGIPLEALISAELDNLLMAGRCISGDFHMHASYRVTGNAVAMGEAAGAHAALGIRSLIL